MFTSNVETATGKVTDKAFGRVQVTPAASMNLCDPILPSISFLGADPPNDEISPAATVPFAGFLFQAPDPVPAGVKLTVQYVPSMYAPAGSSGAFVLTYPAAQ